VAVCQRPLEDPILPDQTPLQNPDRFITKSFLCRPSNRRIYMKKTIAILALAAVGITSASAGVHFGISLAIPLPIPVVVASPPVVVAPAPVVVTTAPVFVPPPLPTPVVEVVPVCPWPGAIWVGGNWGWCDRRWVWTRGHWNPPGHWGYGYRGGYRGDFHGSFHGGHGHR